MPSSDALSRLASDIVFSVAFSIANELLQAAREAHMAPNALVTIVLFTSVVLVGAPNSIGRLQERGWSILSGMCSKKGRKRGRGGGGAGGDDEEEDRDDKKGEDIKEVDTEGLVVFLQMVIETTQRITITVCVQLMTQSVNSMQPYRSVNVLSLLSIAFFFIFLQFTSGIGMSKK